MSKEIMIKGFDIYQAYKEPENYSNCLRVIGNDSMQVSDGCHTIDELYNHRITLYIALCKQLVKYYTRLDADRPRVWRSKLHSDGSNYIDWFILGINKEKGDQITYHIPLTYWDECYFAETLDNAPEWDKHTSDDVLERIKRL